MKFLSSLFCLVVACSSLLHADAPMFTVEMLSSPEGELILAQRGRQSVELLSPEGKLIRSIALSQVPSGMCLHGDKLYVTTFADRGLLEIYSLASGEKLGEITLGSGACSPVVSADGATLYVCNQFSGDMARIDLASQKLVGSCKVLREPKHCLISKDGRYLYVTNFLPHMRADADLVAACVSIIDLEGFKLVKNIELANGSNALRAIAQSPDGQYVYVSHNLGRYTVPTSQLQQGWMNTSAFSVIATETQEYLGSIVVDEPERGAAGIWDIDCDEQYIYISHSGTHEMSLIKHPEMIERLKQYEEKEDLAYDLRFLLGLREFVKLEGNGPRNFLLRGGELLVPTYFSDILNLVDVKTKAVKSVAINPQREESKENRGEKYFNDAMLCFQQWQSCNGCHPGDARTDGMNWDLLNDGIGNPKNCKSLLFSHVTPPSMITGVRETAEIATRKGFTHIQFYAMEDDDYADSVDAYLKGLKPVPSPYLVDGELSEKAERGKLVFEKRHCGMCHKGPLFTDMKMHVIGNDVEFEEGWDTPTLREVWRTAPYLFDGRAATMKDVFSLHRHGIRQELSEEELEELSEYVLSL